MQENPVDASLHGQDRRHPPLVGPGPLTTLSLARSLAVARAVALALALVACISASAQPAAASDPPAPSSARTSTGALVAAAAARTGILRSAFTMTFHHSTPTTASTTPRGAFGSVDFSAPSGTITLELSGGPAAREQMVFRPGTVFIKPPESSLPLQPGRPWIFANFADIAKYSIKFPPYIVQTESLNPDLALAELAWGATKAASYPPVDFAGVPTHHYRTTVNLNQALARASGPAATEFVQAITTQIMASGGNTFTAPVSIPMDVWVDSSGRVIGIRVTPPGAGIGTVTLALHRIGSAVHAAKPPRAKVVDIAAMLPGGEQEALNGGDSDGA
jgi:hypothetical protein